MTRDERKNRRLLDLAVLILGMCSGLIIATSILPTIQKKEPAWQRYQKETQKQALQPILKLLDEGKTKEARKLIAKELGEMPKTETASPKSR
jgi:hypothetical protein